MHDPVKLHLVSTLPCTRYQYDGIQFTIYNCSIQLIPTQPSMQTQPLSVPCPHVRPNIIPHIASSASPVSQRQQYIQQKVIAGKRTFTFLPPPCDPFSTTLAASVGEHLARALQSLGTGKSLSLKDIEVTQNPRLVAQRMSPPVIFQAPAFQVFCPSAVQQQSRCRIAPNVLFFVLSAPRSA